MGNIIIHLKHCYITNSDDVWNVSYCGIHYELKFKHGEFDEGKVIAISSGKYHGDHDTFLAWLSVFFGEDCTDPFQREDTRHSFNRGGFSASQQQLQEFLDVAFEKENNYSSAWEKALFAQAMNYYLVGLRNGISMMPLTIGFFGLSMECIGNLVSDQNRTYFTLGTFRFNKLVNDRFESFKKDKEHGSAFKAWQKEIEADSKLVHAIRNAVYGHSLLHIEKERKAIVTHLHKWLKRAGASDNDAAFWFKVERLEMDLQIHADGLYKIGARSSRLLIFLYLGIVAYIPFAEYDYRPFGDAPKNRTVKFDGMSISISAKEASTIDGSEENGVRTDSFNLGNSNKP